MAVSGRRLRSIGLAAAAVVLTNLLLNSVGIPLPVVSAADIDGVRVPVDPSVEGQPLAANVRRVAEALTFLGAPLDVELVDRIAVAARERDAAALQELIDPLVGFVVRMNPEVRVKVQRGPAPIALQQFGFTPVIVKVLNDSTVTRQLKISSPQSGPVYAGAALAILQRQAQTELKDNENAGRHTDRFLSLEMFEQPPMTAHLSGLNVEYAIALISSAEAGKREATIQFDVGAGTQDIGFRAEVPVLFDIQPAVPVRLSIVDVDGSPSTARITIRDRHGRIYPPQAKRLAPDFFFQPQIYRHDGEVVLLPPGEFDVEFCRGPEYHVLHQPLRVAEAVPPETGDKKNEPATRSVQELKLPLARWIDPMRHGFYCGDHHIHGAGCSHYDSPTQGVTPADMFRQVKGEGLNVGCVLTWGPCFEFQRNYFSPGADAVSEPLTILKYDLEISGFGSAALGHVCLLNLRDQTYPGSEGRKDIGWPTWTVPVLKWCREQGGVTGYPHSAMHVNPTLSAQRFIKELDTDADQQLTAEEAASGFLPEMFEVIDDDGDRKLTTAELLRSVDRESNKLPNRAVPDMHGGGAMEICVSTAEGVCDFISSMDTARIPEWNTWYHLMNCGFPLKLSGETDFPCMSSRRVGQGRVYVRLGDTDRVDFTTWCQGIAAGRSYVSDGFAHALEFSVSGRRPGEEPLQISSVTDSGADGSDRQRLVRVEATVAFAPETPIGVAYGTLLDTVDRRMLGDTVNLHAPRHTDTIRGGQRRVEIVVNGQVAAAQDVVADGTPQSLVFEIPVSRSSWIALRQFPQLHTNPVDVIVDEQPIRASADSARWCRESVRLLWENRHRNIAESERPAARAAYDRATETFLRIERESPAGFGVSKD